MQLSIPTSETFWDTYISALIITARTSVEQITWRTLANQQWKLSMDMKDFRSNTEFYFFYTTTSVVIALTKCPIVSVDSVKYIDENGTQQILATTEYEVDILSEPARVKINTMPSIKDVLNCLEINFTCGYNQTSGSAVVTDSVTVASGLITKANHGLYNGNVLTFTNIGTVTNIATATQYYIINATTNTFQISTNPGGAAINLTGANITPPTYQLLGCVTPEPIKAAMKLLITEWFNNRAEDTVGTIRSTEIPHGIDFILNPYKLNFYYPS